MIIRKFIKDSLTDQSGESYSIIAVLGVLIVVVFLVLSVWSFLSGKPFDGVAYGTGAGLAIAAMAAAIKIAEPAKDKPETKQ